MAAGATLVTLLYDGAAIDPAAIAVEDGDEAISHEELIRRIESMGSALRELLPAGPGRVALCAGNNAEHLVCYLAILVAGYAWVPINPANGRALNSVIAEKARPDLIIADRESIKCAPDSGDVIPLDTIGRELQAFEPVYRSSDDVAAIKFTGGTSGEPKGVVQTHGNMLAVIENMQAFYDFVPGDCNLAIAPLTHDSSHYMIPVLARGGRHRFIHDRSPASIIAALEDDTSIAFMPPTLIYKLLQEPDLAPERFPRLRHLTYSAAPMPPQRIAEAQRAFGPRISALYGQTEAPVTICGLGPEEMCDASLQCTVGKACHSSEVRVVDDSGTEVPAGTVGNIETRGPIVMKGYLDEPGLSESAVHDGWLRTGDLGYLDESGYLTLSGRASEVIITGGFNVYPSEVENVLASVPGVRECCVYAVEDDYWGERIEAVVVPDGDTILPAVEIIEFLKQRLGPVRAPKALHIVGALPRNAVGKVVRREMAGLVDTLQEQSDVRDI